MAMTSQHKLVAGTITLAVLAAAGAAFAAIKLDHSGTSVRTVAARPNAGIGGFGLGGRLGGRGFGGGVGPGERPGSPGVRPGGIGFAFGLFGQGLASVTGYLGIDATTLRGDLAKGQTLAQIAKAQGKSADGLIAAVVAAEKKALDSTVASGRLSQSQEQSIESRLSQAVTATVNGTRSSGAFGRSFFGGMPRPGTPHSSATA
jgi:hypothetical protein